MKGSIENGVLVKRGKQVVKYRRLNGYAVPIVDLDKVKGVQLYTSEDGVIYSPVETFFKKGIFNDFNGEKQQVLPVQYWERIES